MRITKRQLRRIIKEEKARLLNEVRFDPFAFEDTVDDINQFTRSFEGGDEVPQNEKATEFASKQLYDVLSRLRSAMYAVNEAGGDFFTALDMAVKDVKEFG